MRTFALESMVYRAAGMIDRATQGCRRRRRQDPAPDESPRGIRHRMLHRQGLRQRGPRLRASTRPCRFTAATASTKIIPSRGAYRDSRVNRIFEGTNEINRMLIIQMLMKRALSGTSAAAGRRSEAAGRDLERPLVRRGCRRALGRAGAHPGRSKKAFLLAAGAAMQKYREQLADQQEIVGALADIVIEIYAMESALLRAQKSAIVCAAQAQPPAMRAAASRRCWKTAWDASKRARGRRWPLRSKATCCARNSPCCAAS